MSIYKKIANIQDQTLNIPKDGRNPHFSNTYATYEQVMEVLHPLLRKEGLMICHSFESMSKDMSVPVTTHLVDLEDDKKLSSTLEIPMTKNDPQMAGSAITYAKRYSVLAMLGLGTEDDDGNSATTTPNSTTATNTIKQARPAKNKNLDNLCPKCGGEMWDNRPKKASGDFNPAAPDFKCKDAKCGGVIWPAKDKPMMADGSDYKATEVDIY